MPTTTVYSSTDDGYIESSHGTYATARGTGGSRTANSTDISALIGQYYDGAATYYVYEGFLDFNVSAVPNVVGATNVDLKLTSQDFYIDTNNFTITAGNIADYASLATADWVAGASLSGLSTAATHATSSGWVGETQYTFTNSGTVLLDDVKGAGNTSLLLYSSRTSGNNTPTDNEYIAMYTSNQTGTSQDPQLEITAPEPAAAVVQPSSFRHLLVR